MPLKDIFRSNSKHSKTGPEPPQFTFLRSDTHNVDVIHPPTGFPDVPKSPPRNRSRASSRASSFRDSFLGSHRRSKSTASINIPADLPAVDNKPSPADKDAKNAEWEHRAALLVGCPATTPQRPEAGRRSRSGSVHPADDESIQEAIRLHEAGELERSTKLFRRLADPYGPNSPLAQVLYGLALRHGWGTEKSLPEAMRYLQAAAQNSAAVEEEALKAGMKKGGAAKGELVLALYELGNSFREGWGVNKDPVAAREYYETAANLGDSDAQNEVARCYEEGFGCKKDKKKAAKFYRAAEKQGNKTLGNSWIYKDKYADPAEDK